MALSGGVFGKAAGKLGAFLHFAVVLAQVAGAQILDTVGVAVHAPRTGCVLGDFETPARVGGRPYAPLVRQEQMLFILFIGRLGVRVVVDEVAAVPFPPGRQGILGSHAIHAVQLVFAFHIKVLLSLHAF